MGVLSKIQKYADSIDYIKNSGIRQILLPAKKKNHVIFSFSDNTVHKPLSNLDYTFKLALLENNTSRPDGTITLSVPAGETVENERLPAAPQLLTLSETTADGDDIFIEWNITPYVQRYQCLPKKLVVTFTGPDIEFWPNNSTYSFFAPRIEITAKNRGINPVQAELLAIVGRSNHKGVIIYPPTIDWNIPLFQRPQQLMRSLAEEKYLCFYMTSNHRHDDYPAGFSKINDYLYITHVSMETFSVLPEPMVILSWAMNINYLQALEKYFLIYDYIDDISIFHLHDRWMEAAHRYLLQKADIVTVTAERLLKKAKKTRPDAVLCPNAADAALFTTALKQEVAPYDLRPVLESGKPVVGYYGALAKWVDYDLIQFLAEKRPDLEIVLIGPDFDGSLGHTNLTDLNNVTFLGPKHYKRLPDYLACFDVAVIPFQINDITLGTNPIKMYEYMCAGKPVVTTNMPECARVPFVLVGKNKKHFVRLVGEALELKNNTRYTQKLISFAKSNTWGGRARLISRIIEKKRQR